MKFDPLLQQESVEFIRLAIHKDDPKFAQSLARTIKNICSSGQANREEIWGQLTNWEQERFRQLLSDSRHFDSL